MERRFIPVAPLRSRDRPNSLNEKKTKPRQDETPAKRRRRSAELRAAPPCLRRIRRTPKASVSAEGRGRAPARERRAGEPTLTPLREAAQANLTKDFLATYQIESPDPKWDSSLQVLVAGPSMAALSFYEGVQLPVGGIEAIESLHEQKISTQSRKITVSGLVCTVWTCS